MICVWEQDSCWHMNDVPRLPAADRAALVPERVSPPASEARCSMPAHESEQQSRQAMCARCRTLPSSRPRRWCDRNTPPTLRGPTRAPAPSPPWPRSRTQRWHSLAWRWTSQRTRNWRLVRVGQVHAAAAIAALHRRCLGCELLVCLRQHRDSHTLEKTSICLESP